MLTTLLLLSACRSTPAPAPVPDLVVVGHLHDGLGTRVFPGAVVIDEGRITEVVTDGTWKTRVGEGTEVLETTWITPGFVDAHAHPLGLGRRLSELDLTGAATYAETLQRIGSAPPSASGWLTGRGWDQNDWPDAPEGGWPLADDLEPLTGATPTALRRVDGHAVWVNRAALTAAGITRDTADPTGGRILRGPDGEPTGVLIDEAMSLVTVPEPTTADRQAWLKAASAAMLSTGLTGAHMMGAGDAEIALLEKAAALDELPVRLWIYASPDSLAAERLQKTGPWGSEHVKVVGVKAYADGALGSRGALLSTPYTDEPEQHGLAITTPTELNELAVRLLGAGSQLAVHAIGDAAVTQVLDTFATARTAHPHRSSVRLRVEHAQVVSPSDLPRFAALNAVASVQPTHATSDMPWAEQRLGAERIHWAYAWQDLRAAGALLALGSDAPVEDIAPSLGIWAATTRTNALGEPNGGWHPDQRLSVEQTVQGFTASAAAAVHEEERLGTLKAGQLADLSLWGVGDGPGAQRWLPEATVIDGRVAWRAPSEVAP